MPTPIQRVPASFTTQNSIRATSTKTPQQPIVATPLERYLISNAIVSKPPESSSTGDKNFGSLYGNATAGGLVLNDEASESDGSLTRRQSSLGSGFLDPNAYRFMEVCQEELEDVDPCDYDPQLLCAGESNFGSGGSSTDQGLSIPTITPTDSQQSH
jgi:hypothetical protein